MNQAHDQDQRVIEQFAQLKRRFSILLGLLAFLLLAWIVVAAAYADRGGSSLLGIPLPEEHTGGRRNWLNRFARLAT